MQRAESVPESRAASFASEIGAPASVASDGVPESFRAEAPPPPHDTAPAGGKRKRKKRRAGVVAEGIRDDSFTGLDTAGGAVLKAGPGSYRAS